MNKKLLHVNLLDLYDFLGSSTYEIIKISTTWCEPCKMLKKAIKKIIEKNEFKNTNFCIYEIDGDEYSIIQQHLVILNILLGKNITFPISYPLLLKLYKDIIKSENADTYILDVNEFLNYAFKYKLLKQKNEFVHLSPNIEKIKKMILFFDDFHISGYPTMIFCKNGAPISTSLDENDYYSRGFAEYDQNKFKDIDITKYNILTVELSKENNLEKKEKVKIIQLYPKCEARIVGFESENKINELLRHFFKM